MKNRLPSRGRFFIIDLILLVWMAIGTIVDNDKDFQRMLHVLKLVCGYECDYQELSYRRGKHFHVFFGVVGLRFMAKTDRNGETESWSRKVRRHLQEELSRGLCVLGIPYRRWNQLAARRRLRQMAAMIDLDVAVAHI